MAPKTNAVIIRRAKKPGHAQRHGGHWKVAYADFMTAMMAFFLLLWILSVSDKTKLEGIAEFFTPTEHPAGQPGGEGILQGSAMAEKKNVLKDPGEEAEAEEGASNPWAKLAEDSKRRENTPAPLGEALERAGQKFLENVSAQPALANLAGNLLVRQIEGQLVVDILDLGAEPMFESGSSKMTENMRLILRELVPTVMALPHPIKITGHSDQAMTEGAEDAWTLSGERAQAVRRELVALELDPKRFMLISGAADTRPLDPLNPSDPKNRRVTLELGSALD